LSTGAARNGGADAEGGALISAVTSSLHLRDAKFRAKFRKSLTSPIISIAWACGLDAGRAN
jgi:hypothetical protein